MEHMGKNNNDSDFNPEQNAKQNDNPKQKSQKL